MDGKIFSRNRVTLYNIASTVILQGLAFISGPIFSSVLGTSNYGIASVYLTWVQIASTVFSLQAADSIALARVHYPMKDQEKFQSSVFSLATLSYFVFSLLTIIIYTFIPLHFGVSFPMVVFGLAQGWGTYCVKAMNSKFTYEFKANKNFFLSVITSACTIGLSLFLIKLFPLETNYWGRIIGQSVVYTVIGITLTVYILKCGKTVYNSSYWKFTLPIAIPTIFHLLAIIVLNQSDKVMLQSLIDNSAAGIYALACTFGAVLSTIYSALNNSWVPFYYEYTRQGNTEVMIKHARNYIELFTILSMGFILLAKEVFYIYAKSDFWGGTDLIPIFSLGYYFVFLYSFPVNYEFYNKKSKTIALGTGSAAVINIILNYFMIKYWGIQGAVIATAVSHGLQFAFHWICAKRITPGQFPFKLTFFIPGLFAVCATCLIYYLSNETWIVRWMFSAVLGIYIISKIIKRKEIF